MRTVNPKARGTRKRMFGPTGSLAHSINIYKKSFFLPSTKTEALIGAGTAMGQGIPQWTKSDTQCVSWWTLPGAGRDGANGQSHRSVPSPSVGSAVKLRATKSIGTRQSGIITEPGSKEEQEQT